MVRARTDNECFLLTQERAVEVCMRYNSFDDQKNELVKHEIGLIKFHQVSFHSCPSEAIRFSIKP